MIVSQALGYEIVRIGIAIGAFWWVRISDRYPRRLARIANKKLSTVVRFQSPAENLHLPSLFNSAVSLVPARRVFAPRVHSPARLRGPIQPCPTKQRARSTKDAMRCEPSDPTDFQRFRHERCLAQNAFRTAKAKKEKEKEAFRYQWLSTHRWHQHQAASDLAFGLEGRGVTMTRAHIHTSAGESGPFRQQDFAGRAD